MREVGAVLSLKEHNQSVISISYVLLLSPGPPKNGAFVPPLMRQ